MTEKIIEQTTEKLTEKQIEKLTGFKYIETPEAVTADGGLE